MSRSAAISARWARPAAALLRGRGAAALGDQAVLSLGNFLTNLLLIRHLSRDAFGNFAVLLSVILFLNNLQAALVTYPLCVIGGSDDCGIRPLVRRSVAFSLLLAGPFAAVLAAVAWCMCGQGVAIWAVAAMLPWQLQETLRRGLMAKLQHGRAIAGDALSYLGQALIIAVLVRHQTITIQTAFAIVALTSAAAAALQAVQLRLFSACDSREMGHLPWRSTSLRFWTLGRWVLLSNLFGLLTIYATPWLLRYFHGAAEVAAYQALANLLGVSNPVVASMAGLIVPAVAKAKATSGIAAARRTAGSCAVQGFTLLAPYYAALLLVPRLALRLLYGSASPYQQLVTPLRLMVLIYALYYVSQAVFGLFNGLGKSRWSFFAQLAAAGANAAVCLPLAVAFGMIGAVWGGCVPMLAQLAVAAFFLRQLITPPKIEIPWQRAALPEAVA